MKVRIATRRSPLAVWQAEHVAALLQAGAASVEPELVAIDTDADRDLTRSIAEFGGKGAFSKSVQQLVLDGRADIAVHSAKDLQAITPDGLTIGAYPERGTAADCLVGAHLADLPSGATVATGSPRRRALLLDLRPDLKIDDLRGNIATRLSRLADFDAIVMAAVALERLGADPGVVEVLDPASFVPQVGQGALAVECRTTDVEVAELLAAIDHGPTRTIVTAERSFLLELGGDCDLPAGAHATLGADGNLMVRGVLAAGEDHSETLLRAEVVGQPSDNPGRALAIQLRSEGTASAGAVA